MNRLLTAALASFALTGAAAAQAPDQTAAEELAAVLTGSFSTIEQCETEGWGCVESELVRIWPERTDGVWLYQENAWLGDDPESADPAAKQRPYFQRIIRLAAQDDRTVLRTIYTMTDPASVVGAFAAPDTIAADQLGEASCSGPVERIAHGHWYANFPTCPSGLRGAVRTHSRSIHYPDGFANWDRGFDAEGNVRWGPSAGGYVFVRKD
ncbi:MAG: chromophore lyase CpcT/CpeT [Oceanicaulis sp.]